MSEPTYLSRSEYLAGKAAWRELVEVCGGGAKLATNLRADPSMISRAGNPHHMDRWPCLDQVADAEAMAGDLPVTRFLAGLQGHVVVPADGPQDVASIMVLVGRIARETGDVVGTATDALGDGRISDGERADICREIREAIEALKALEQRVCGKAST